MQGGPQNRKQGPGPDNHLGAKLVKHWKVLCKSAGTFQVFNSNLEQVVNSMAHRAQCNNDSTTIVLNN